MGTAGSKCSYPCMLLPMILLGIQPSGAIGTEEELMVPDKTRLTRALSQREISQGWSFLHSVHFSLSLYLLLDCVHQGSLRISNNVTICPGSNFTSLFSNKVFSSQMKFYCSQHPAIYFIYTVSVMTSLAPYVRVIQLLLLVFGFPFSFFPAWWYWYVVGHFPSSLFYLLLNL